MTRFLEWLLSWRANFCACECCRRSGWKKPIWEHRYVRLVDPDAIRQAYRDLDEAAYRLPIAKKWLKHPDVEAFNLAKHRVHVLVHQLANAPR